jgi:hypothetical protein
MLTDEYAPTVKLIEYSILTVDEQNAMLRTLNDVDDINNSVLRKTLEYETCVCTDCIKYGVGTCKGR